MELINPQLLEKLNLQILQPIYQNTTTGRAMFLVRNKTTFLTYALKVFDLELNSERHITTEMIALNRLPFALAPHVHAIERFGRRFALLMDWIDGDTFSKKFSAIPKEKFDVTDRLKAITEAAKRLYSLHLKRIYHRDVKPDNLIINGDGKRASVWIIDFGNSTQRRHTDEGTLHYRAPEQYLTLNHMIEGKTDVFSLAQVAWFLLTGGPARLVPNGDCSDWLEPDYPFFAVDTGNSSELFQLLESATAFNPKQRIDMRSFIQKLERLNRR